jgi:hypothetical protein
VGELQATANAMAHSIVSSFTTGLHADITALLRGCEGTLRGYDGAKGEAVKWSFAGAPGLLRPRTVRALLLESHWENVCNSGFGVVVQQSAKNAQERDQALYGLCRLEQPEAWRSPMRSHIVERIIERCRLRGAVQHHLSAVGMSEPRDIVPAKRIGPIIGGNPGLLRAP